jgi:hypothetical protein
MQSVVTSPVGRLCNQIIRNLATSLLALKNDCAVSYSSHNIIKELGIPLYSGNNIYDTTIIVDDNNYMQVFKSPSTPVNIDTNGNFFQTQEITDILYSYINSDNIKSQIVGKNPYKSLYGNNNNVFVHIRLEDILQICMNLPYEYYEYVLNNIKYNKIYISTSHDLNSVNSEIVQKLLSSFPNSELFLHDEVKTIQFASTCKHVILSQGSFSACIGWLAFDSTIYYTEFDKTNRWCGNMFPSNNRSWIQIPLEKYKSL